jgi:hypothetical protein
MPRPHPQEFRQCAVELTRRPGSPIATASRKVAPGLWGPVALAGLRAAVGFAGVFHRRSPVKQAGRR